MKNIRVENIFNELNVIMSLSKNVYNKKKDKNIKVKLTFQSLKKTCDHEIKFYCFEDTEKIDFKTFLKYPKLKFKLKNFSAKDVELENASINMEKSLVDCRITNINFDLRVEDYKKDKYFCFLTIDDKLAYYNQFKIISEEDWYERLAIFRKNIKETIRTNSRPSYRKLEVRFMQR